MPRDVVDKEQRKRLVLAIARVVAEKGYADVTVTDITSAAGVSRSTFYQLFVDKEECFLYGFSNLAKVHLSEVRRAIREEAPHPEQLLAALNAYLRCINADLTLARAFIAEAESATARSRTAFAETQGKIRADLLQWLEEVRSRNPEVPPVDGLTVSLMMSGLSGHIVTRVRSGQPFVERDVIVMFRYVLACLGLYGWAQHASESMSGAVLVAPARTD